MRPAVPICGVLLGALLVACGRADAPGEDWRAIVHEGAASATEPVSGGPVDEIHAPLALEGLPSGMQDVQGREIPIACETCHGLDGLHVPAPAPGEPPGGPHVGFTFDHGERPCAACHDPADLSHLRLADGTSIPVRDAMQLCAQCHGPQHTDYLHGSHGGMRGHWDSARGTRLRNHCVDCHDPHAPAIPAVEPMPPPRDRFRPASGDHAQPHGGHAREEAAHEDDGPAAGAHEEATHD